LRLISLFAHTRWQNRAHAGHQPLQAIPLNPNKTISKDAHMFGFDPRIAKKTWTVFLVALLLFIIFQVRLTLLVLVFAIFFAYLIHPLVRFVDRNTPRYVPRTAAIAVAYILIIGILATAVTVVGTRMADEAANLGQQLPALLDPKNVSQRISLPAFLEPMREHVLEFLQEQFKSGKDQALPLIQRFGTGVMQAVSNVFYIVLIPILGFLLIKDAPKLRAQFLSKLDHDKRGLAAEIVKDLHIVLAGFVRALLLLSLATFIGYSIAFTLLDVPYALILAGVAALLEFIPVVGPLSGAIIVLGVAAVSGYENLLWLAAFFLAYQAMQEYMLSPYLMSEELEIPPLLVIVGVLAGEQLGGIAGMFLSIPVIAALRLILTRTIARRKPTI
jgi:predicted PurR-regulated permease PerM